MGDPSRAGAGQIEGLGPQYIHTLPGGLVG